MPAGNSRERSGAQGSAVPAAPGRLLAAPARTAEAQSEGAAPGAAAPAPRRVPAAGRPLPQPGPARGSAREAERGTAGRAGTARLGMARLGSRPRASLHTQVLPATRGQ